MIKRAAALIGSIQVREMTDAETTAPAAVEQIGPFTADVRPPSRETVSVSGETALRISTVYRAVEVLAIGVSQLGIDQWRNARRVRPSSLIEKPCTTMHRPAFLEYGVVSLALDGNAYWRILRGPAGEPIDLRPLNPRHVTPYLNEREELRYSYRGQTLTPGDRLGGDIVHSQKLRVPGRPTGLGPIEAARHELTGAAQALDYSASWFERGDVPSGILSTEDTLSPDEAKAYKNMWAGYNPETGEYDGVSHGVRVLGKGLTYDPLQIKPSDLQFLETQQFNTTQIARLFGTPASLMLAAVEGNSQTYSNVEQDWIAFTRFTLMTYIRELEEALSSVLPHGNRVRFNVDALHRSDTLTRYQAHEVGIRAGFLTRNEAREIEGFDPLDSAAELPAPADKETEK